MGDGVKLGGVMEQELSYIALALQGKGIRATTEEVIVALLNEATRNYFDWRKTREKTEQHKKQLLNRYCETILQNRKWSEQNSDNGYAELYLTVHC